MGPAAVNLHTIWSIPDIAEGVHEHTGHATSAYLPPRVGEEVKGGTMCRPCTLPTSQYCRFLLRIFFGVLGIVVIPDSFHRKGLQTKVRAVIFLIKCVLITLIRCFSVTSCPGWTILFSTWLSIVSL